MTQIERNQDTLSDNNVYVNNDSSFERPSKPKDRLVLSIVATVLGLTSMMMCCIGTILGAIAIVYATQVDTKYYREDYNGAKSSSQVAYVLSIISLALSFLSILIFIFFYAVGGIFSIGDAIPSFDYGMIDRLR